MTIEETERSADNGWSSEERDYAGLAEVHCRYTNLVEDGYNDVEMLEKCGVGVAVENAVVDAKEVATVRQKTAIDFYNGLFAEVTNNYESGLKRHLELLSDD